MTLRVPASAWKMSHDLAQAAARQLRAEDAGADQLLSPAAWRTLQLRIGGDLRRVLEPCCEAENGSAAALPAAFPVADRLVRELSVNWRNFVRGFLQHWAADAPALTHLSKFAGAQIPAFGAATSDPHDGGKRVLVLRFPAQHRLVYKPRSLGCEVVFQRLLAEINACGFPWPLRTVAVLDGGDHGWMEYVEARACRDRPAAEEFHLRAGALVCLLHALAGVDGHSENLVPAGSQPVLIDLETLLHPATEDASIFRTGLLPVPARPGYGVAAFAVHRPARHTRWQPAWEHGFSSMCDVLERQIDLPFWIARLAAQPRRELLRATDDYYLSQRRLLSSEALRSPREWAQAVAGLGFSMLENEALSRLDIPRLPAAGVCPTPTGAEIRAQVRLLRQAF